MPKRSARKAPTRMTTAWTKRERRTLMPASFEGQQEGDEVHVLLRRQGLAEDRWHDAFRVARDAAPERLEQGHHRPELGSVEPDRRLVDARHDVRIPLDEVGAGIEERFDQILLGALAGLALGGAGADPGEIGGARALLADLVADLAGPLRVEDLLARLDQLRRRDVATLQRELLGGLGLDLGDRVGEVRVHAHDGQREDAELEPDWNTHR